MTVSFEDWLADLAQRTPMRIRRVVRVVGVREKALGPRADYAQIEIVAEPATRWTVHVEVPAEDQRHPETESWIRSAILGILDILVTQPAAPLLGIRLRVVGIRSSPIHSTQQAFRWAGRDAGAKLLAAVREVPPPGKPPGILPAL